MNITTIDIPKNIEYLEHVPEVKTIYNGDLPHNAIIDKQLTGTGGTHLALTNSEPYIVAVHLVSTIKNKVEEQEDKYGHVLGVYGNITEEQIQKYVNNGGIKILTTYDSVPKVQKALGSKAKDFRLLVDEFHKLINYLGSFKPTVCLKLLEASDDFKSKSYLTATPTNYKYLPEPMKNLDIVEFNWEGKTSANLKHTYVKEGIVEKVLALTLDKLDNTDEELFIFYNSRVGVVSFIKKLFKCKPNLSLKDLNIMFSENELNTKFFKKHLGMTFKYGIAPNGINNKRINLISSMAFEGQDFYPNETKDVYPTTIIVADPSSKSLLLDIDIDVKQIIGRFRKHRKLDKRVPNPIIYLWNTQKSDFNLDEEDFKNKVLKEKQEAIEMLDQIPNNNTIKQIIKTALSVSNFDHIILNDNKEPMLHPYGFEAKMSQYSCMHCDSAMILNIDENNEVLPEARVTKKLLTLNKDLSTYEIPFINSEYTKALGRSPSITKLVAEYELLVQDIAENKEDPSLQEESINNLENFLVVNPLFKEWLDSGVTPAMMKTHKLNKELISKKALENRTITNHSQEIITKLNLKIGEIYRTDELLKKITKIYKILNITTKPKATDIKKWYEIKSVPKKINGQQYSAYKIIKEI